MSAVAELNRVVKRYDNVAALNDLSLTVQHGEVLAILGPNGAGKTTAISLFLNLQQPDAGVVQLCGSTPDDLGARQQMGCLLQSSALSETLRVRELIELAQCFYPHPRDINDLCQLAGIKELLPQFYGKLSGGQQRRVQFALAICAHVNIVFLDEPTVGMDIEARENLWRSVKQLTTEGCAVVLTTHYLEEAEALADRVIVIAQGNVVAEGSVEQIRSRVSLRRIRCVTTLALTDIAQWPDVEQAVADGHHTVIHTADAEAVTRKLLQLDESLQQLEIKRAGLADAFSELTREQNA